MKYCALPKEKLGKLKKFMSWAKWVDQPLWGIVSILLPGLEVLVVGVDVVEFAQGEADVATVAVVDLIDGIIVGGFVVLQ